jgi:hypothetical protein
MTSCSDQVIGGTGKLRFELRVGHLAAGEVTTTDFIDHKDGKRVVSRSPSGRRTIDRSAIGGNRLVSDVAESSI